MKKSINKIIYFDKETIGNILQEQNRGAKTTQTDLSISNEASAEVGVETNIKLGLPIWDRLSFLFSGKMNASFLIKRDSETTITSTEISEFEKLKKALIRIESTMINDIENSSTFFRVAGGYLRIMKGGVEGVDTHEFKAVMDGYDGYDTYRVDDNRYVRFNNSAFVSNYKRNDLLTTKMTMYCIEVGAFNRVKFDFFKQLSEMEKMITVVNQNKSLADVYPSQKQKANSELVSMPSGEVDGHEIVLYDVVYACITTGGGNE